MTAVHDWWYGHREIPADELARYERLADARGGIIADEHIGPGHRLRLAVVQPGDSLKPMKPSRDPAPKAVTDTEAIGATVTRTCDCCGQEYRFVRTQGNRARRFCTQRCLKTWHSRNAAKLRRGA